jgi:hypothetical protein
MSNEVATCINGDAYKQRYNQNNPRISAKTILVSVVFETFKRGDQLPQHSEVERILYEPFVA